MQLQLSSVFFTFSLGTRTHYFGRTILHGGAKVWSLEFRSNMFRVDMCYTVVAEFCYSVREFHNGADAPVIFRKSFSLWY
jgi:hypothetical protein